MSQAPFMQLYVGDYFADTQGLNAEEHGAYLLLLMTMWTRGSRLPMDHQKLARIARVAPRRWAAVWEEIGRFFTVVGGDITQKRLAEEYEKATAKSEIRRIAGKRGGEAKARKTKETAVANATDLPQHLPEPETEAKASDADGVLDFNEAIWTRGVAYLVRNGVKERNARSILGKWKSQHGDQAVFEALAAANRAGAPDPVAYITAALKPKLQPADQKLESWGIGDAQPLRIEPRPADLDAEPPAGTTNLSRVQDDGSPPFLTAAGPSLRVVA